MVTNNAWNSENPAQVAKGGSGAATLTGVLTGNGTSPFTVSTVTDNTVIMGSTSNLVQDTTITVTDDGEMVNTSQPAFLAYQGSSDANVTGDGTIYTLGDTDVGTTLTEAFDQNSDFTPGASGGAVFTAPVTGKYYLGQYVEFSNVGSAHVGANQRILTSNRVFRCGGYFNPYAIINGNSVVIRGGSLLADMDSADTVTFTFSVSGGTKVVGIAGNATVGNSYVFGNLEC